MTGKNPFPWAPDTVPVAVGADLGGVGGSGGSIWWEGARPSTRLRPRTITITTKTRQSNRQQQSRDESRDCFVFRSSMIPSRVL